jgi:hypothetical protein
MSAHMETVVTIKTLASFFANEAIDVVCLANVSTHGNCRNVKTLLQVSLRMKQ